VFISRDYVQALAAGLPRQRVANVQGRAGLLLSMSKNFFSMLNCFPWTQTIALQGIHGLGAGGKKQE